LHRSVDGYCEKHKIERMKYRSNNTAGNMKRKVMMIASMIGALVVVAIVMRAFGQVQQPGIKRTELQRHDLSVPGREVIQSRIDFAAGSAFGKHSHPGEEIIYVIEGILEYEVEGKAPVKLKAGEVLFIPAGVIHAARNTGRQNGAELATYVVEKGKQLVVMAE
jgi:quercetin dioxygenase-like cupin family protein